MPMSPVCPSFSETFNIFETTKITSTIMAVASHTVGMQQQQRYLYVPLACPYQCM